MTKPLSLATTLILALASTSLMTSSVGEAQSGPPCTGVNHCVDIVIVGGVIQPVGNVVASGRNHQIDWRIVTSGFTFGQPLHPDGVTWKPPSSINDNGRMPPNEFQCNRASAVRYHCNNANSTHGMGFRSYQYAITVIDPAGNRLILDPWVINN